MIALQTLQASVSERLKFAASLADFKGKMAKHKCWMTDPWQAI